MRLGFYINPIARLRESHISGLPDPALAAALAEAAGAQIILAGWVAGSGLLTERDVLLTRELVRGDLIIVTHLRDEAVENVLKFHPDGVILVDGAWDGLRMARPILIEADSERINSVVGSFRTAGVPAALLIEPSPAAVKAAKRLNAAGVVFDCASYSTSRSEREIGEALDRIGDASLAAEKYGIAAGAAHGLTNQNLAPIAGVRFLEEIYLGQGIAVRSLMVGLNDALREVIALLPRIKPGNA